MSEPVLIETAKSEKIWKYAKAPPLASVAVLAEALQVDEAIAWLLCHRKVCSFEQARDYFRPDLNKLHDPFLMKDMDKAVDRLTEALHRQERILVYGDYDVDGTTSIAVLYRFIASINPSVQFYVPDRHKEGYGLSMTAVEWSAEQNIDLIITLDCGITAVAEVEWAKKLGIDVVVTDHHLPSVLPAAYAILNPKQPGCTYPFKELSGCGIGFKLVQAYIMKHGMSTDWLTQSLDLVAVSIAADFVPLTGENRILVYFGLQKLNQNPCPGLKAVIQLSRPKNELTVNDIVFSIAPRINAAGRMGDARQAVELLLCCDMNDADVRAAAINTTNSDRRDVDAVITREAIEMARCAENFSERKTMVVYGKNWHKGVLGIVASRLVEQYYRPSVVFSQADGLLTGSARTVNGFNIYQALSGCSECIEQFGGHEAAAGLIIKEENLSAFCTRFEQEVDRLILDEQLVPSLEIERQIRLSQITPKFYRILRQFAPFGHDNPKPVFASEAVFSDGSARVVGENHLLLRVQQDDGQAITAIAFGSAMHLNRIAKGLPFNMAYTIEENTFRKQSEIKLIIKDIKFL
ncbi:MAG: single-stranded-DNA-specific exonuclease RecJ [Sphingomonadales bacterium]|nr:single-stranded-DNA-specific exonuclease RecJ [Sphingomonadales bacterium]